MRGEHTLSDAPALRITYQSCLVTPSAIADPSAGTLQNLCTFLVRVPALGAVLGGERGEQSLIAYPDRGERC